jgi:hypothetical protein
LNPRKKPGAEDPPSQQEIDRAEALFARSASKKTFEQRVRKKTLEHMVNTRLEDQAHSMDGLLSSLPSIASNSTSASRSTDITSSSKSDYVEFLFKLVSATSHDIAAIN